MGFPLSSIELTTFEVISMGASRNLLDISGANDLSVCKRV
jgi:hypothetical protein